MKLFLLCSHSHTQHAHGRHARSTLDGGDLCQDGRVKGSVWCRADRLHLHQWLRRRQRWQRRRGRWRRLGRCRRCAGCSPLLLHLMLGPRLYACHLRSGRRAQHHLGWRPSRNLTPVSAGLGDFEMTARLVEGQARVGHRFFRRGLLPGLRGAHQLHRKSLRCTAPSNPTSNPLILASFCLRRSSRLVPTCGVRISRFLPACVRRKQAHHPSCPSRTGGGV